MPARLLLSLRSRTRCVGTGLPDENDPSSGGTREGFGRVDVGVVPERFRGVCWSKDVVTIGTGTVFVRNCAAEAEGRSLRFANGNESPELEDVVVGTAFGTGAGEGEELLEVLFVGLVSDCVLALPLRFRFKYAAIASASRSRTRFAMGDKTEAGLDEPFTKAPEALVLNDDGPFEEF